MATALAQIEKLAKGLKWIEKNFDKLIIDLVKEHEKEVIRMNVDDQLFAGINAKGAEIRPPYSPQYARFKRKRGQPSDRVTLKLDGDFHKAWFIIYKKDSFEFDSKDFKKKLLMRKYGEAIFGLTDKSKDKLRKMLKKKLIDSLRKHLVQ